MKISYNPKSSQTAINTETAANDDIIFDLKASKLWAKGVRIGADWADITSKPSSLKNPAAIKFKDINGNVVTYDGSVAKDLTSGTYMANRLTTARNIALGTDLRGSANFDGSGNITINANINACTVSVGSTDTLPFKRIAHFETTNSYNDNALLLYISEGYINGRNGICRVEFRTDNISSSSTSISASAAVRWLVRNGYGLDALYAGYYVTAGKAYIDIYLKTAGGYRGTVIRVLQDSRGSINSAVQLISAKYSNDTNHKEAYSSVEAAATALYNRAYTRIVSGSDSGIINYANSTGSTTKLQTARKLWGQSFDGTKDISGSLSGTGSIIPGSAGASGIGSNSLDYRYGYFQWIGAKSGTNLRLAANNSDNQIVLHTNGNVGIGTNSPSYKLDVRGNTGISGSIIFPTINDTAISSKISWSGSSDGADIYYQTTAKDQGNLVLNVKDDTNAYIQLALNGVFKSHFDVANSYWTGRSALADKWTTSRTFTIGNTAKNVDGSGNVSWSLAEIGVKDTWRTVQVNGTSIGNNTLNLCGSTYIGLTNVDGKVTFSLVGSGTTANQAILSNGTANGWALKTLNIANWDAAYNLRHSHANKSVLDGITSGSVSNWNTAYTFVHTITGTDTDNVINKWDEIVNFLAGITEDNKLNTLLNSKLSVYKLADKTNVGAIKNNGIYYSTTDASSGTLTNSPFNNGFTLINMTSLDGDDDLRRSRLAFNAFGEIKVSDDRDQANTAETWYNVLTSKNSGISGSTIKLNGTSITVYSSGTADGRYVKKSGDTMTGALNFANNTWNRVGDDSYVGDCNVSGHVGIRAANTTYPGVAFFNNSGTRLGNLTAYGSNIKYGTYSLQFLDNGNTSVNASTCTNPFLAYDKDAVKDGQAVCVWGQGSFLSNLASDGGNMALYLKRINANAATLNMILDGEYYAGGNQRLAHVSELPTKNSWNYDDRYLKLNGSNTMQGNLNLFSYGISYIGRGSGDKSGEDFTEANIVIRSWWGISFKSFDDKVRTYIDTRTGNIGTKGKFIGNLTGNATSATKVIVNQHTTNDVNYPLVWSNQPNTSNVTENQLYKSWADLYYNPKNKKLVVGGSISTAYISASHTVTSAGFKHSAVTKNANQYVLTADGGYTFLNQTSNELAHEFSVDITVTSEWTDIEGFYGGNQSFLTQPGTYIVQVFYETNSANGMYQGYFSGIMSWYTGTTNSNNADEIVLHRVGHAYSNTIYLRTRESLSSEANPYTKLQISANSDLKQHTYKFKFKRIC